MLVNKFLKSSSGAVMVEFALVAMILILLLVGIIQFGMVFSAQLTLQNAAREGARYAAVPNPNASDSLIKQFIIDSVPTLNLTPDNISITPSIRQRAQPLTVTINYNFKLPVTLGVLPESYNLTASTVMMRE